MSKRIFTFPIPADHIEVDVAFIGCIEPRLWNPHPDNGLSTIDAFMRDQGWTFVPLTVAGGIKVLVSDNPADAAEKESLFFRIDQELNLHHPKIIAASVHEDCGRYGYSVAFGNDPDKEGERLQNDLRKAEEILRAKFGSRIEEIRLFIFDFEGVEEVEFAQVVIG
jgi:hypothetical protein